MIFVQAFIRVPRSIKRWLRSGEVPYQIANPMLPQATNVASQDHKCYNILGTLCRDDGRQLDAI
jgi:hypothetical protein